MSGARTLAAGLAAALLVVALAWAVPWLRFVLTVATAKGIAVLGILLLLRAGQVSFGHAMYLAIAAYTAAFLAPRIPDAALLLPVAVGLSAAVGLVVGLFVMRYRDIFFGMLNLALSMVFYSLLEKLYSITHGTDGIRLPPLTFAGATLSVEAQSWAVLLSALVLALVAGAAVRVYWSSPLGEALAGIKTREQRLDFLGVPPRLVLLAAYVISAALAGIGGFILAMATRQVTPALAYWTTSGELVFIAVLGGAGSVFGAFLGAAAYELTRVYAAAFVADAWQMILGSVLLLVILFAPGGIWGIGQRLLGRRAAGPGAAATAGEGGP
jgi:branched-chain amino acid transport system permease protein